MPTSDSDAGSTSILLMSKGRGQLVFQDALQALNSKIVALKPWTITPMNPVLSSREQSWCARPKVVEVTLRCSDVPKSQCLRGEGLALDRTGVQSP